MTINYRLFDFKKFTSTTADNSLDTAIQTAVSKTTSAATLANQFLLGADSSTLVTSGNSTSSTKANPPSTLLSKILPVFIDKTAQYASTRVDAQLQKIAWGGYEAPQTSTKILYTLAAHSIENGAAKMTIDTKLTGDKPFAGNGIVDEKLAFTDNINGNKLTITSKVNSTNIPDKAIKLIGYSKDTLTQDRSISLINNDATHKEDNLALTYKFSSKHSFTSAPTTGNQNLTDTTNKNFSYKDAIFKITSVSSSAIKQVYTDKTGVSSSNSSSTISYSYLNKPLTPAKTEDDPTPVAPQATTLDYKATNTIAYSKDKDGKVIITTKTVVPNFKFDDGNFLITAKGQVTLTTGKNDVTSGELKVTHKDAAGQLDYELLVSKSYMPKNDFLLDLINNINGTNGNFPLDTSNPDFKTSFSTVGNLSFANNQTLTNYFLSDGKFTGTNNNDLITILINETGGHVDAGDGNDTITGGSGNDTITAGMGNDTINETLGDNIINGSAGNDTINSGSGNDIIRGGTENDTIIDISGANNIDGGDGDDTITGGLNDDTIIGGNGNDNIKDAAGNNSIAGGAGNDIILGGSGNDTISGNEGNDSITDNLGSNNLDGGEGNDTIMSGSGNDTVNGGDGNDVITDSSGNDIIIGGIGDDIITDGLGNNSIDGGIGNDTITGGSGNETITGGSGNDEITDNLGKNSIDGGEGNDTINSGSGNDTITGSGGDDTINDKLGDNSLDGGDGNDTIDGSGTSASGNNTVFGGAGDDTITFS